MLSTKLNKLQTLVSQVTAQPIYETYKVYPFCSGTVNKSIFTVVDSIIEIFNHGGSIDDLPEIDEDELRVEISLEYLILQSKKYDGILTVIENSKVSEMLSDTLVSVLEEVLGAITASVEASDVADFVKLEDFVTGDKLTPNATVGSKCISVSKITDKLIANNGVLGIKHLSELNNPEWATSTPQDITKDQMVTDYLSIKEALDAAALNIEEWVSNDLYVLFSIIFQSVGACAELLACDVDSEVGVKFIEKMEKVLTTKVESELMEINWVGWAGVRDNIAYGSCNYPVDKKLALIRRSFDLHGSNLDKVDMAVPGDDTRHEMVAKDSIGSLPILNEILNHFNNGGQVSHSCIQNVTGVANEYCESINNSFFRALEHLINLPSNHPEKVHTIDIKKDFVAIFNDYRKYVESENPEDHINVLLAFVQDVSTPEYELLPVSGEECRIVLLNTIEAFVEMTNWLGIRISDHPALLDFMHKQCNSILNCVKAKKLLEHISDDGFREVLKSMHEKFTGQVIH